MNIHWLHLIMRLPGFADALMTPSDVGPRSLRTPIRHQSRSETNMAEGPPGKKQKRLACRTRGIECVEAEPRWPAKVIYSHYDAANVPSFQFGLTFGELEASWPTAESEADPPSFRHKNPGNLILCRYVRQHEESGLLRVDPQMRESCESITAKIDSVRKFLNDQQKEDLRLGFFQQLQTYAEAAHLSDTCTLVWDRAMVVHVVNQPAAELLGWRYPLPSKDTHQLIRMFSPEMAQMIIKNVLRVHLDTMKESVVCRSTFSRVDFMDAPNYKTCNFVLSVKRDLMMLPQLFVLQIIPDPPPTERDGMGISVVTALHLIRFSTTPLNPLASLIITVDFTSDATATTAVPLVFRQIASASPTVTSGDSDACPRNKTSLDLHFLFQVTSQSREWELGIARHRRPAFKRTGGTPGHVTIESSMIVTVSGSGKSFSAQHTQEQANNSFTATTTMEHPRLRRKS
ncbi:hypothetical protein PROFUN_03959 [Planoprotostelium fungivorum]|uniref:PAS domain-containing protein n=1 Tax=Planoprotostelium fungivorum TaxID=1890364 RepID=A0A2P6MTU5_9EUKA|nr:hypothetical protein PROFUN_03959 [Planoprotostelium fungivorum]